MRQGGGGEERKKAFSGNKLLLFLPSSPKKNLQGSRKMQRCERGGGQEEVF